MLDEMLEVYDREGAPTGTLKPRSEVHEDGDWHKTVQVWVCNAAGDVLLQKRQASKIGSPGKWDVSCGGHCIDGETPESGALREIEEELGLVVSEARLQKLGTLSYTSQQGKNNEFIDVFLLELDFDAPPITFQEVEIEEVRAFPLAEIKRMKEDQDPRLADRDGAFTLLFETLEAAAGEEEAGEEEA